MNFDLCAIDFILAQPSFYGSKAALTPDESKKLWTIETAVLWRNSIFHLTQATRIMTHNDIPLLEKEDVFLALDKMILNCLFTIDNNRSDWDGAKENGPKMQIRRIKIQSHYGQKGERENNWIKWHRFRAGVVIVAYSSGAQTSFLIKSRIQRCVFRPEFGIRKLELCKWIRVISLTSKWCQQRGELNWKQKNRIKECYNIKFLLLAIFVLEKWSGQIEREKLIGTPIIFRSEKSEPWVLLVVQSFEGHETLQTKTVLGGMTKFLISIPHHGI